MSWVEKMSSSAKRLNQVWSEFWFSPVHPISLRLTRITLGTAAVVLYIFRFWQLDYYNENSIIPADQALELIGEFQRPLFSWNFWPDSWVAGIQTLYMALLVLFTLGWTRRPLMILMWVLHVGFLNRNFAASMGVDTMVTVFLFYLSWCEVWKKEGAYDLLTRAMVRMAQVHLCVIYFYTGLEKLRGATWWEGSSLWIVFNNPQLSLFNMDWTVQFPSVLAVVAHVTVLFELFFGTLVMNPRTKFWVLGVGICFHVGIAFLLGLWTFSAVMLAPYFLFLNQQDWGRFQGHFRLNLR